MAKKLVIFLELLHLAHDLLQAPGHEIGPLFGAIIPLTILQEAKKQCIDSHGIDAKEETGDHVGTNADDHDGCLEVVQGRNVVFDVGDVAREEKVGQTSDYGHDHHLSQEEQEVDNVVQDHHPQDVAHQQGEGVSGRGAKVGAFDGAHDVSVAVDEAHKLFQTPQAALADADETLGQVVVVELELVFNVRHDGPDELDDGNDARAKGHGAKMVKDGVLGGRGHGTARHVRLFEGPVPGGKGAGQDQLAQGRGEADAPVETKDVVELHPAGITVLDILGELTGDGRAVGAGLVEGVRIASVLEPVTDTTKALDETHAQQSNL